MEYTVDKLAKLAGVSARTLRYYDQIGLLRPCRITASGYRIYGQQEVDRLQQILLYRELGMELSQIDAILSSPDFGAEAALEAHLTRLMAKREQINKLIANVEKSLLAQKGVVIMTDKEKFEGFKQKLLDENEEKYGAEIREKYGEEVVEASYRQVKGMTPERYAESERLSTEFNEILKAAFVTGDPGGELAQKACALHQKWLTYFYPNYSKEYHRGLGEMYVSDARFTAYYDKIAEGCAPFLRDAINLYTQST